MPWRAFPARLFRARVCGFMVSGFGVEGGRDVGPYIGASPHRSPRLARVFFFFFWGGGGGGGLKANLIPQTPDLSP